MSDLRLHDGIGCWLERLTADIPAGRPALFLDRDGVIVEETHYLSDPADVRVIDGAANAIARCNTFKVPVIIVTNQAGIARGYYGWPEFEAVQAEIIQQLDASGAHVDFVLACAYHDQGRAPYAMDGHPWRKPNPGMIEVAANLLNIDRARSVIVGDKLTDLEAGAAAGLLGAVLVLTGHGRNEHAALEDVQSGATAFTVERTLGDAVEKLFSSCWSEHAL